MTWVLLRPSIALTVFAAIVLGFPNKMIIDVSDDPVYNQFEQIIELDRQLALSKLNFTKLTVENITNNFNIVTNENINSTLTGCYSQAVEDHPSADPTCLESLEVEVQQVVNDSILELEYCDSFTQSIEQLNELTSIAGLATDDLDDVVNKILSAAQSCVKRNPSNPSKQYQCMLLAQNSYSDSWNNATSNIHQAYNKLSGVALLLNGDLGLCQNAENGTITFKCNEIQNQVESCEVIEKQ